MMSSVREPSYREVLQAIHEYLHDDLPPPEIRWLDVPRGTIGRMASRMLKEGLLEDGRRITPLGDEVRRGDRPLPWRDQLRRR
jgi:hypothetical protein